MSHDELIRIINKFLIFNRIKFYISIIFLMLGMILNYYVNGSIIGIILFVFGLIGINDSSIKILELKLKKAEVESG